MKENSGRFPTDLSQLSLYLSSPIDDAIVQRYEIVPTKTLIPRLRESGGDWAITQKTCVDEALDTRRAMGPDGPIDAGEWATNRWTTVH